MQNNIRAVVATAVAIGLLFLLRDTVRQFTSSESNVLTQAVPAAPIPKCPTADCSLCPNKCPSPLWRTCDSCQAGPPCPTCPVLPCPSRVPVTAGPPPPPDCTKCFDAPCLTKLETKIKTEKKLRVVVSMAAMPCKLWGERIYEIMQGIKEQTYQPDQIYLVVSEKARRDGLPFIFPKWIKEDPDIMILKTKEDIGPLQKLLPVVAMEKDPETRIITIDDDWGYPNGMIQQMVEWQLEHPEAAMSYLNGYNVTCWLHDIYKCNITIHGRAGLAVMTQQDYDAACFDRHIYGMDSCAAMADKVCRPVHVIQGVGGSIFVRRQFGPEFFELGGDEWYKNPCFFNDDIYTSGMLAKRGVPRMVMPQKVLPPEPLFADGREPRKVAPWKIKAFAYKGHHKEEMPYNETQCAGDLHSYGNFGDYNIACSRHFNHFFEEERYVPEYWEDPNFFLPVERD